MVERLPVILVPGLLCSTRLYSHQIQSLWRLGPVMIADHTRGVSMAEIADSIVSNAPPRFALVGLSMGGYIALEIVRQAPQRVTQLALLDTGARSDSPEQSDRRRSLIALARSGRFEQIADQLFPKLVHPTRRNDEGLLRQVRLMAQDAGPEAFVRQQEAIINRPDSRAWLGAIACKTLVIVGDGDEITPPELSEEIANSIPFSQLVVVPNCGHLSTLEQPGFVTQSLMDWLREG